MRSPRSSLLYFMLVPILAASLFAGVWLYTLREREAFLDSDYGQWAAKLDLIKSCKISETVIVGDSRASAAFVPGKLGMRVTNLALSGSTSVEAYYELKQILACPHPPTAVIMAFAPPQFEHIDWLWQHAVRYGQLGTDELGEIADADSRFPSRELYHGNFGAEPAPVTKNWLYAHHFPPYDFASLLAAGVGMRRKANQRIEAETLAAGGQHVIGTPAACAMEAGAEAAADRFRPNPLISYYFKRTLTALDTAGVATVIVNSPYSDLTAERIDPSYKAGFEKFIAGSVAGFSRVVVLAPAFSERPSCDFGDRHHLNEKGAEAFSELEGPKLSRAVAEAEAAPLRD